MKRLRWLMGGLLLLMLLSILGISILQRASNNTPHIPPIKIPGVRSVIDTTNNIHVLQSFSSGISNPATVAKSFDFVWGPKPEKVAAFRSANPNALLAYYFPFNRDNGTYINSGAYHSLHYWQTTHPDWVLYQCDRKTPAYEFNDPNIPLDITNPQVLNWFVQTYAIPASENGNYDAIAADNVNMGNIFGACGIYKNGQWVQLYSGQSTDPLWAQTIVRWLDDMQHRLHELPHPLALIPNFALDGYASTDPLVVQAVEHMDGLVDEDGFTHNADRYATNNIWLNIVQFMKSVQARGKAYYSVNQFKEKPVSQADIQWALSSYLMAKDNLALVFISSYQDYGRALIYKEYSAPIGSPTEDMRMDQGVYWRAYTGGLSIVNPSADMTYTITLPSGKRYVDLYRKKIDSTLTLLPHSGVVLLNA